MKIARSGSTKAKKGVTWKKGQACSSNPTRRKFRDAVRTGTFQNVIKESGLTAAALNQHDAIHASSAMDSLLQRSLEKSDKDESVENEMEDARSVASSWATEFSACTNMSFNKLVTNWDPSSALHKEMLAVLAAVTEVIKEKGGQETETEYLAAFLTTLTTLESDMSVTATVALINLVIKRVPPSLLRQRLSDISKVVCTLLARFAESDHNAVLCSLLNIASFVCRQQDISRWTDDERASKKSETHRLFNAILAFVTHSKPRVRRAAQKNVCGLMRLSPEHPSALLCGAYVNDRMEEFRCSGNTVSLLHLLTFLSYSLPLLPSKNIKTVAENILKAMRLNDPLVVVQGMTTLSNMLMYETTQLVIRPDLNARLINALYDYQPGLNDPQPLIAWLMAMRSALVHLHKADVALFALNIGKFVSVAVNVLLCENETVHTVTEKVIIEVVQLCGSIENEMNTPQLNSDGHPTITPAEKIVIALEGTLTYRFHLVWPNVLAIWGVAFAALAKALPDKLATCVPTLADLRELDNFECSMQLDRAIGAAVRALGPKRILEKIPLKITGVEDDPNFPRSWLLPVLHDNIKETELKFFIDYFFPLTGNLSRAETAAREANKKHMEIAYRVLGNQVWSLLPSFCNRTTDVQETFPKVARTLVILLTARPERRLPILSALRKLITTSTTPGVIGGTAETFLPTLCSLYIKKAETERLALYETIRAFVTVSEPQLCCTMFNTAMEKVATVEGEDAIFMKIAFTDIARALLPKVTETEGEKLYEYCVANLKSGARAQQKKAYMTLEDLFRAECCRELVERNLNDIQKLLVTSVSKVSNSSKAPRLRCLRSVLANLSSPNQQFVTAVIPEAVLCCRESAMKVKQAALEVVVECADALHRWSIPNAFSQYISLLMGGLAGSPTSISASVTAIGHCIRHFREQLQESEELLRQLIEAVCTLVVSPSREIVKAALDFIKGIFSLVEMEHLAKFADLIISRVCGMMTDDCASHFRLKIKGILTRFVRRFGYDLVSRMIPESYRKVLTNINKLENRRRKGKSMASGSGGSDSDEENEDLKTRKGHRSRKGDTFEDMLGSDSDSDSNDEGASNKAEQDRKKKTLGAWLKEGDEEIVDLMDPSAMRNISTTDPEKYKQKLAKKLTARQEAEKAGFKMSEDGKLLITKEMLEKGEHTRGKKRGREAEKEDSDLEDIDDLLGALSGYAKSAQPKSVKSAGTHKSTKSAKSSMSIGSQYRSKKAKGDVKSKDQKYDPYAYIPMSRMALNKRKRAKMSGQFNNIVKGATKGARKGRKQRAKQTGSKKR